MIKISVIVAAYNEEKYIASCLESLLNQDFDPNEYEIILVNNNSTDRTKEIASRYNRVKIFDEARQGVVNAQIKGCNEASGEIFVFTDADTVVPHDWLSQYWQAFQDKKIVLVGGSVRFEPATWITKFIVEPAFWLSKAINGFNFSIRKDIYFKIGGLNPRVNFNQDSYLVVKARKVGKISFLRNNLIITSSRRHKKIFVSAIYTIKSLTNLICLALFKKTIFHKFGDIRD